ncbi:MAG: hypothetical protein AAF385_03100 [Pseudomonadota bacterium]
MDKKFILAWLVLFVIWMIGSFLVHGLLLGSTYETMTTVYRAIEDQQRLFPIMLFAHVMLAGGFVWIYLRGREDKPWLAQGLRFGLVIALFAVIPTYLIYYSVQSMSSNLLLGQIAGDTILSLVLGSVVAFLYKDG